MSPGSIKNEMSELEVYGLRESEIWWRDRYELLRRHGYDLRPRFRPGWKPSWVVRKKDPMLCEDGHSNAHPKVIDATRISDGARVAIKKLSKGSNELKIAQYLSSEEMRKDPRNNCVPVLDVFSEEGNGYEFMVMPLLIRFNEPPFDSIDEVIDFMRQTLQVVLGFPLGAPDVSLMRQYSPQGLSFLHSKGVAHRDCYVLNIMMDGTPLYPKGFHPGARIFDESGKTYAYPRRRRDVKAVKYYFTDFGISSRFDDDANTRLVSGTNCQDKNLPEIDWDEPYDPFLADVFILGDVYKKCFVRVYENLQFLAALTNSMTQKKPTARPTIDESLQQFNDIVKRQTPRSLRRLLVDRDADKIERFFCNFGSIRREAVVVIRSWLPSYSMR